MKYNDNKWDRNNRIFVWHHFEQWEAFVVDTGNKLSTRKKNFEYLTIHVDMIAECCICSDVDQKWMRERLEEIVTLFPELIS